MTYYCIKHFTSGVCCWEDLFPFHTLPVVTHALYVIDNFSLGRNSLVAKKRDEIYLCS